MNWGEFLDIVECGHSATIHVTSVKIGYSPNGCEDEAENGCASEIIGSEREYIINACEGKHQCEIVTVLQQFIENCILLQVA